MRTNTLILLAPLALVACNKDKDGTDTSAAAGCDITAAAAYPIDGQPDAYYRSAVEFELSDPDTSATITVTDATGAAVAGAVSTNESGDVVYFTPSSSFASATSYTATLSWCDSESSASISFTTSALGTPLATDITGKTYVVNLSSGRFVEPPGVGDLIGGLLEQSILLGIVSSGSELEIRGALSKDDGTSNQDTCYPTLNDFPAADFTASPYFEIPEGNVDINVAGYSIRINAMSISGTFAADGTYFGGGILSGELDARDLGPLLADQLEDTSPDYICDLLVGFGVQCIPCSSDGATYCATIYVDQLVAEEQAGEVMLVEEEDCHETCVDSCGNAECPEASSFPVCQ